MTINCFWFRRDLRLHDNAGLYHALRAGQPVLPVFIFDSDILEELPSKDARVDFIHQTIRALSEELQQLGSTLIVRHGEPARVWKELLETYEIESVYTNRDYEPSAIARDEQVSQLLQAQNSQLHTFKDQVIFEKEEVLKKDGTPYTVFTPYSKQWRKRLETRTLPDDSSFYLQSYPTAKYQQHFHQHAPSPVPTLSELDFESSEISFPPLNVSRGLIRQYDQTRNFPAQEGTSKLGIHFRFGTISIREKARHAAQLNQTYLNELIWRDFYSMILAHFPRVVTQAFRAKYDAIPWRNDESEFAAWCTGKTGYPIVDAGMRQLNATGYMHNRVRMVTASFLTKHLLIDWRWGEAYFAEKLLDFDLASNNGGWQWAAGSGTDAAPYFRIFNPTSQQQKFDKKLDYIQAWIPEYNTNAYVKPIVEHKFARARCLATYKAALQNQ